MSGLILPKILELDPVDPPGASDRISKSPIPYPEREMRLTDPATGKVWGYVVVDNTIRGPGLGGVRIAPDLSLNEVRRLARAMTLKNSAANIPFGGGKSGILAEPEILNNCPGLKRDLIGLFAAALFPLDDYITAPDMGTDEEDIQQIYLFNGAKLGIASHARGGAGRPLGNGGIPIDEWGLTAHSLFAAMETLEKLEPSFSLRGAKVIVQGFGNVGAHTANKCFKAGAVIAGVSDIHAGLWKSDGLDMDELNRIRFKPGGLDNYSGLLDKKLGPDKLDWLLEFPCDILIPCARPDAITARNADRIQCRTIFQGANSPSSKMTEYYLQNRRDIVSYSDFIVNVGGVIGCAVELRMAIDEPYRSKVMAHGDNGRSWIENLIYNTVAENMKSLWLKMKACNGPDTIFRELAEQLAIERLEEPSAGNKPHGKA